MVQIDFRFKTKRSFRLDIVLRIISDECGRSRFEHRGLEDALYESKLYCLHNSFSAQTRTAPFQMHYNNETRQPFFEMVCSMSIKPELRRLGSCL